MLNKFPSTLIIDLKASIQITKWQLADYSSERQN